MEKCQYCKETNPDPEWGVLWSKMLGSFCCFRCYITRACHIEQANERKAA